MIYYDRINSTGSSCRKLLLMKEFLGVAGTEGNTLSRDFTQKTNFGKLTKMMQTELFIKIVISQTAIRLLNLLLLHLAQSVLRVLQIRQIFVDLLIEVLRIAVLSVRKICTNGSNEQRCYHGQVFQIIVWTFQTKYSNTMQWEQIDQLQAWLL